MTKKTKQYFGTDGIRGAVGTAPITPDFMLKLGWAAGTVFAKKGGERNKHSHWQGHTYIRLYV